MSLFEKAARMKLRFDTPSGTLSAEDLWDVPLINVNGVSLDSMAIDLNRQVKEEEEGSFVLETVRPDTSNELRFELVKHVIAVRLAEAKANEEAVAKRAKKSKLLEILASKEDEALKGMDADDIRKMIDEM